MTQRNVIKALIGIEDIVGGVGTTTQTRNGSPTIITKTDIAYAVSSTAAMQDIDVTRFTRARVYTSATNVVQYYYDPLNTGGIASTTGSGSWFPAPEDSKVLAVDYKLALRDVEPAFNQQLAVALGGTSLGVGNGGIYWYDETDTTTADDGEVVLVTTGSARWKKLALDTTEQVQIVTAGGSVNALTAAYGISSLSENRIYGVRAVSTSTGNITLNIDGLGAKSCRDYSDTLLPAGAIEAGKVYLFIYVQSLDRFILVNPSVSELVALAGADNTGTMTALRVAQALTPVNAGVYGTILDSQIFTSNGTWTKPLDVSDSDTVICVMWSGGGSGAVYKGGAIDAQAVSGGNGGGCFIGFCRVGALNSTESVVVGQGGAAVTLSIGVNAKGEAGGNTSFAGFTLLGGLGGYLGGVPSFEDQFDESVGYIIQFSPSNSYSGGLGFPGTQPSTSIPEYRVLMSSPEYKGGQSFLTKSISLPITVVSTPGNAIYGGAGGGNSYEGNSASLFGFNLLGGVSLFGGNGGAGANSSGINNAIGQAGTIPGGGGGGAHALGTGTPTSGAGARGEVRLYVVKGWQPFGLPIKL